MKPSLLGDTCYHSYDAMYKCTIILPKVMKLSNKLNTCSSDKTYNHTG